MDVSTAKIVEAGGSKAKVSESKQQSAINYMEDPVIKARLNDIRRDLYMGGIKGLVQGISVGAIAIYCTNFFPSYKKYYNKNNFLAAVLITGDLLELLKNHDIMMYIIFGCVQLLCFALW
jgi:uncharacterized Fe-S cluster-containing radical SAM superfamily protein